MKEEHRLIAEDLFSKFSMALSQTGQVVPVYIMILEDDQVYPILLDNPVELHEYSSIVLNVARQYDAVAMMLVCEQYMVSKKTGDSDLPALLDGSIRASEHPDKEEYMTLVYMDKDENCDSIIAKIHQDPAGTRFTRDFKWLEKSVTSMMVPWK